MRPIDKVDEVGDFVFSAIAVVGQNVSLHLVVFAEGSGASGVG